MNFIEDLNSVQYEIIQHTEGAVLVLAGAGSGKTRVLTYRIAYLMQHEHVDPYNILAITFTNKATREMMERIHSLDNATNLWVSTFHAFCARVLRMDGSALGYTQDYTIYTESDVNILLRGILADMSNAPDGFKKSVRSTISYVKNFELDLERYIMDSGKVNLLDEYLAVYTRYRQQLRANNALDFDDLLLETRRLFLEHPDILEKYQRRFRYIHVDEFQDTNRVQYQLMRMLAAVHGNIFAVGDEDQSIYGWRGANINNILNFQKDFDGAVVFKLEQNYRSTKKILDCANRLIENNTQRIGKTLFTDNTGGVGVERKELYDERAECEYVSEVIYNLVRRSGYDYSDIAVLVRLNALTRGFEQRFSSYGIPYRIFGGQKFYERKEIKDIIAYLQLLCNPADNVAFKRVVNFPARGVGEKSVSRIEEYATERYIGCLEALRYTDDIKLRCGGTLKQFYDMMCDFRDKATHESVYEVVRYILATLDLVAFYKNSNNPDDDARAENVMEFMAGVEEYQKENPDARLSEYLQALSLYSDLDQDTENCVTISTIHLAKGLEFKAVFIVGLEEGGFPSEKSKNSDVELEEERRVAYVAVTRAMERLYLTYCQSRFLFDHKEYRLPSRFLEEMLGSERGTATRTAESLLRRGNEVDTRNKGTSDNSSFVGSTYKPVTTQTATPNPALRRLSDGTKVKHPKFGYGVVISRPTADKVAIAFPGKGIITLNINIAPLEIIE